MAKTEYYATMDCPMCGASGAEVRDDKNGQMYSFCPANSCQSFTRGLKPRVEHFHRLNFVQRVIANENFAKRQEATAPESGAVGAVTVPKTKQFDLGL